ncbi:MAG: SHD1 domain-containing protein [Planctomycetota bacterium]|nr:SHD1 domain-containing protein [Planctomycetota bacterium]
MNRHAGWILVCVLFLSGTNAWAKMRTWTAKDGQTVKGEYVRIKDGSVVLKLNNGKVLPIPFANFSETDQDYIRELLAGTDEAAALPKPGAAGANRGPGGIGPNGMNPGMPAGGPGMPGMPAGGPGMPAGGPGMPGMPGGPGMPAGAFPGAPGGAAGAPGAAPNIPGAFPSGPPGGAPGMPAGGMAPGIGGNPGMPGGMQPPQMGAPGMPGGMQPPQMGAPGMPGGMSAPGMSGPGMGMPNMSGPPGGMAPNAMAGMGGPPAMSGPPGMGGPPGMSGPPRGMGAGPSIPTGPQMVKLCSNCNKEVPQNLTAGDKCPHCKVFFGRDETNGKTASGGFRMNGRAIGGLIGLAVAALGGIGTAIKKSMS